MKDKVILIGAICLMSCGTSIKLTVPERFKQESTMQHVDGARGNKMSFAHFTTSRIKRGMHVASSGWGRDFFLENLLLNQIGIQKNETVTQEKARFRYTLTDGKNSAEVYANERQLTVGTEYQAFNSESIFNTFGKLDQYTYIFSAIIVTDTTQAGRYWELLMSNFFDRKRENAERTGTFFKQGAYGLATNGKDTIIIKPVIIKNTVLANGKTAQMPFKILSGYELSIDDAVIAIVDMIDRNIWFYNELEPAERLNVGAIATAIFARRVHDEKW